MVEFTMTEPEWDFMKLLEDVEGVERDKAVFECDVNDPEAEVTWWRGDKVSGAKKKCPDIVKKKNFVEHLHSTKAQMMILANHKDYALFFFLFIRNCLEVESMKSSRTTSNADWLWRTATWRMTESTLVKCWTSPPRPTSLWNVSPVWQSYAFNGLPVALILSCVKLFHLTSRKFWELSQWLRKLVEYCSASFKFCVFVTADIKFFKKLENKRERETGTLVLECKASNPHNQPVKWLKDGQPINKDDP